MADTQPTPPPAPPAFDWKPLAYRLAYLLMAALIGAIAHWAGVPAKVVEKPVVVEKVVHPADDAAPSPAGPVIRNAMGWVRDDDEVRAVASGLPHPAFAGTPAGQVEAVPDHAYLWDAAKAATGRHIPARDQGQVGSCVSFGSACAVEYSQCVARVAALKAGQPPPEFKPVAQEVIYGGSRVQIGGGRIRGDGSVGAWAAKWCQEYGSVARGKYGSIDLSEYSESRCRSYGNAGCPASLVPTAKEHPTKTISQVKTVDEAKKALASGYPVTVASDVGFGGQSSRNERGQLRARGVWQHQMCLIGYDKGSGFYCMNSWGESWVGGPAGPGDPPAGGFYIEEATVARMLSQNDSWAYGDQVGFPGRKPLDWAAAPARPRLFADRPEFALAP